MEALQADIYPGAPASFAELPEQVVDIPIVNAGDGSRASTSGIT